MMFGQPQAIGLLVGFGVAFMASSLAAVDDCSEGKYWDGKQCLLCSRCPRGFGVKTNCSSKQDTECQACLANYDYSDTSGFGACINCDTFSNCLPGRAKKIKNCTIFSPPVCDGCEDGSFFDPIVQGCIECSRPCSIQQEETRPCTTKHDRICSPKRKEPTKPVTKISPSPTVNAPTKGSVPGGSDDGTEEPDAEYGESKTPVEKEPWFWIIVPAMIVIGVPVTAFMFVRCRSGNAGAANVRREVEVPMQARDPLLPPALDCAIKLLEIEKKKRIARMLNGKDCEGYFYWQITAEKLGLGAECRAWEGVDNPTEKLLSAYGEREGSTARNFIKALREAELGYFANEIERMVSQDQGEAEHSQESFP